MLHPTSAIITRIMLLYFLSNVSKLTASVDGLSYDTSNNVNDVDEAGPFDMNEIPNKRTYTHLSEYKRLPVYNFGLGKRQIYGDKRIKPYSFGLGKRSRGYSFGLGKKVDPMMDLDYDQLNNFETYSNALVAEKKNNRYNFGLGKRSLTMVPVITSEFTNDHPKRVADESSRKYLFGLGKKSLDDEEDIPS